MMAFCGRPELRTRYQAMLDGQEEAPDLHSAAGRMLWHILELKPVRVVEVGCGNGRLYRQLRAQGRSGIYAGIEAAASLVDADRRRHPEAIWNVASANTILLPDSAVDMVFSVYVLEHLVYAVRALEEMLRLLAPDGRWMLIFSDFVETGCFGSRLLGFSPGPGLANCRAGQMWDATVGHVDSRFRLPRALRPARHKAGSCLASQEEVVSWVHERGLHVRFPEPRRGCLSGNAFIEVSGTRFGALTSSI